jgi:hypothetical protein
VKRRRLTATDAEPYLPIAARLDLAGGVLAKALTRSSTRSLRGRVQNGSALPAVTGELSVISKPQSSSQIAGSAIACLNSGKEGSTAITSIRMTARQSPFQARRCSTLSNQFDRTPRTAFEIAPAVAAPARSP